MLWAICYSLFVLHLIQVVNAAFPTANPQILPYCNPKFYSESFVCVCNSTYCDEIEAPGVLATDQVMMFTSSKDSDRLLRNSFDFETKANSSNIIDLNPDITYQKIIGFGGVLSDVSGFLFSQLSEGARTNIMNAYFSTIGVEYTVLRVPIASGPASMRKYSYDDVIGDLSLNNFTMAQEDLLYKIPFLQWANNISNNAPWLIGASWSPPFWMKTNNDSTNGGTLLGAAKGPYYKAFAKYILKFIEHYHENGLKIHAIIPQNEPNSQIYNIQSMNFTASQERDFIKHDLGPVLADHSVSKHVEIIGMDDTMDYLKKWSNTLLNDDTNYLYVKGLGIQCYQDNDVNPDKMLLTQATYPDIFLLGTQCICGEDGSGPDYGSWSNAEMYTIDIIKQLSNYGAGWIESNLALDASGGTSWSGDIADATVLVNVTTDEFYKQPTFYAIGHFSKFIRPKAKRFHSTFPKGITGVGFINPWEQRVLIGLNTNNQAYDFSLKEAGRPGRFLNYRMQPRSIFTLVWDAPLNNQ